MSKTIKINGTDFTNMFTPHGYTVRYSPVFGNNGGVMLDGSTTDDELAQKATVVLPIMPLSEPDISFLLKSIYESTYILLYYFDPKEKAYRSSTFRRNQSEQKYRGFGSDGNEYWTGPSLTLTEK